MEVVGRGPVADVAAQRVPAGPEQGAVLRLDAGGRGHDLGEGELLREAVADVLLQGDVPGGQVQGPAQAFPDYEKCFCAAAGAEESCCCRD